jgi:hypothetical protein
MPSDRERTVAAAVASAPRGTSLIIIDGRTGREAAHRPGSGPEPAAALLVVGPVNLAALGGADVRPAIRPNRRDGTAGGDPDDLAWLTPADRRRFRRERNRFAHAARVSRATTPRGATSAPEGAPDGRERPGARAGHDGAPTRPDGGLGSVRGI